MSKNKYYKLIYKTYIVKSAIKFSIDHMFLLFYMVINSMPINKYDRKNSHGEDLKIDNKKSKRTKNTVSYP